MHIGLNAHLLAIGGGYRAAGIHNYIHYLLTHLAEVSPEDWRYSALVGAKNRATYRGVHMRRSALDTRSALRRILWEQLFQSGELRDVDFYHALAFAAPLTLPRRLPFVVTVYDVSFLRYPHRLSRARRLYLQTMTGHTCRRAGRIIAISQSTANDITHFFDIPADKIDVTHLGVDDAIFHPLRPDDASLVAFRARHRLPDDFWLFLGTLEPRKNLPMLLRAYARLPQSQRLPLYIAGGKGWGYDEIVATIHQTGIASDVHLVGFVPTDEIALWYNSATTFIYPSVFEGFGLPVLEAMACGTPVITSDASSLPEVAGDSALTIDPHDEEAWTQALQRAHDDATWRDTARQSGLAQAERFHPRNTAQATVATYRRVLEK